MSAPATAVAISATHAIPSLPKKFNGSFDNWFLFKDAIINRLLVESDCCYQELLPMKPTDPTLVKGDVEYRLPEPLLSLVARGNGYSTEQYYKSTIQKRAKVLDFITNSLEDSIKITYASFNKPQAINSPFNYWSALAEKYTHKTASHIRLLENQLTNERLKESDSSLEQYLGRLNNLFSLLHDAGEPISEKKKVRCLINGLPTSFNTVITNLESQDNAENITLDEAVTKVKRAFDRNRTNASHNDKGKEERRHNKAFVSNSNTNTNNNNINTISHNQLNEAITSLHNALAVVQQSHRFGKTTKQLNQKRVHPYKLSNTNTNNNTNNSKTNTNKYQLPCKFCKQINPNHPYSMCDKAPTCHACNKKGHYANECKVRKSQSLIASSENTQAYDYNLDAQALIVSSNKPSPETNSDERICYKDESNTNSIKPISVTIPLPTISHSRARSSIQLPTSHSQSNASVQLNEIMTQMDEVRRKISTIVEWGSKSDNPSHKSYASQTSSTNRSNDIQSELNDDINNKREVIEIEDNEPYSNVPADQAVTPPFIPHNEEYEHDPNDVGDVETDYGEDQHILEPEGLADRSSNQLHLEDDEESKWPSKEEVSEAIENMENQNKLNNQL
jgi:hypothetical protein